MNSNHVDGFRIIMELKFTHTLESFLAITDSLLIHWNPLNSTNENFYCFATIFITRAPNETQNVP